MLQIIREKTQGLVSWGIVVVIVVVFSLWGVNNYTSSNHSGHGVAAKVNGIKITWQEIETIAEKQRQYLAESNPKMLSQIDPQALRADIKQYLIQQLAVDTQTKRLGFTISDTQLAKRIASDPSFQENGKFSTDKYQQFLKKISETEAAFNANVKAGMLIEQIKTGFVASSFVFKDEINKIMELFLQQRDFGYLIVPTTRFNKNIHIEKADIKKYYEQHQHMFIEPEKVRLSYVTLSLDELTKSITVTEENLREYYKKHEALYTVPEEIEVSHILINAPYGSDAEKSGEAKAKIDDILARIKLGENFASLAKKYSDDPISGANGGNLGKIGHGQTVNEFETASFALTKLGSVSDVIKTEYGYHIIKLIKRYESFVQPYESIHKQLVANYKRELAESQFADKGEELANLAFEYPDSLQHAAEKMHLTIQDTALFTKDEASSGIASIPAVIATAFNSDMIKQTKNSDLIKIDDENYVVIRVKEYAPARPLALEEVIDKIKAKLVQNTAEKQAEEFGKSLLAKLKAGNTPFTIAKEANLEWHLEKDVERNNAKINPLLVAKVFSLPKPEEQTPINIGFNLATGDYAVVSLQTVKASKNAQEEHVYEQFHKQLTIALAQIEFHLYEMSLIEKSKIKIEK